MPRGAYKLWPLARGGVWIDRPSPLTRHSLAPSPSNPEAIDIFFGLLDAIPAQPLAQGDPVPPEHGPPKEQAELQASLGKALRAIQQLYRTGTPATVAANESKFRNYYIRIFHLGQLGLEGEDAATQTASTSLTELIADLIDDEAGRVKNAHLRGLGWRALLFAVPFALAYLVLRLSPSSLAGLEDMGIEPATLANFMLLWIGCLLGVWLSYGLRTRTFTLRDLTVIDADRMSPSVRLLFAGMMTMILGLVFALKLLEVEIGHVSVTDFSSDPMLAFLLGTFCGISELVLPTTVAKRASDFIESIK